MKITEHISDRSKIDGVHVDVDTEVQHIGGSSSLALEVTERIEKAVQEEIQEISDEQGGDENAE